MITSAKKNPEQAQASNRILIGTEIEGDVKSNGDIRIDGVVKGNVNVTGKLVIGEKGKVEGEVICGNASIQGLLKGKAEVKELLQLLETAVVEGDVTTGKLSVEPGAQLSGTCNMGAVVREMRRESEKEKGEERSAGSERSKETA